MGQALAAGAIGGFVGPGVQINTGVPILGTLAGGYAAAAYVGGNGGQGLVYGLIGAIGAVAVEINSNFGGLETFGPDTKLQRGESVYLKGTGLKGIALALALGDAFEHVAIGNGTDGLYDAAPGRGVAGGRMDSKYVTEELMGRQFRRGSSLVDVDVIMHHQRHHYEFGNAMDVCSKPVIAASHGQYSGVPPGQQSFNASSTHGYRPNYIYWDQTSLKDARR